MAWPVKFHGPAQRVKWKPGHASYCAGGDGIGLIAWLCSKKLKEGEENSTSTREFYHHLQLEDPFTDTYYGDVVILYRGDDGPSFLLRSWAPSHCGLLHIAHSQVKMGLMLHMMHVENIVWPTKDWWQQFINENPISHIRQMKTVDQPWWVGLGITFLRHMSKYQFQKLEIDLSGWPWKSYT